MSVTGPTESFRLPASDPILFGGVGIGIVAFVWWLVGSSPGVQGDPAQYWVTLPFVVIGLAFLAFAVQRSRYRLVLEPAGVRVGAQGELIPWAAIGELRATSLRQGFQLIGTHGEPLATIPSHLASGDRAILLLSIGMGDHRGARSERVGGTHGMVGWLAFAGVIAVLIRDFTPRPGYPLNPPAVLFGGLFLFFWLQHLVRSWRRTGGFEYTIDQAGIRFSGRAGAWEARWGEIVSITPRFKPQGLESSRDLTLVLADGTKRVLPLDGTDLHSVLSALRTFGGPVASVLIPPALRPDPPLLEREF